MFEQSILLPHDSGKRTGALAASITMQAACIAILLLVPLIYHDRLPLVQPWTPLNFPHLETETQPPPVHAQPSRAQSSILSTRVFTAPPRVPLQPADPTVIDSPAPAFSVGAPSGGAPGVVSGWNMPTIHVEPAPVFRPAAPPETKPRSEPVPVGGDVQAAKLLKKVIPVYPALARQARVSGTVQLMGVIARDGTIQQLRVLSGNPLLVQAAIGAVRQWVYRPTTLNGEVVEVIAPIDVIFTLSH